MPKVKIGADKRRELGLLGGDSRLKTLDPKQFRMFGIQERSDGKFVYVEISVKNGEVDGLFDSRLMTKPEALYMFRIETSKKVLK